MASERRRPLRVVALTGPFSLTYDAQLTALRERHNASVEIAYQRARSDAPYEVGKFEALHGALGWDTEIPTGQVTELVERLRPDVLLVTSWNYGAYVGLARAWRQRALRVMVMDNPWRATLKQWGGVAISRMYLKPAFDIAFLPNDRQRVFARKLGFGEDQIWDGVYCCDQPRFEAGRVYRLDDQLSFLYVGRLVTQKGVDVLLRAYAAYRRQVDDPWPLHIAGTGPLEQVAAAAAGVTTLGFQQPTALPRIFAGAGCFVLPSIVEPWGIVLHEAAASGLPIICTTACGASLDLVRNGYNGFTVPAGDADALTDAMLLVAGMPAERRRTLGLAGLDLSRQLTPDRWADLLDERVRTWQRGAGRPIRSGSAG